MSVTKTLRAAMFTDLDAWSSWPAGLTPTTISAKADDVYGVQKPAILLAGEGGGEAETETLGARIDQSVQQFALLIVVDSTTPVDDLDDLTDEIRNAIEDGDGTLLNSESATHRVIDANVISWTDEVPEQDVPEPTVLFRLLIVAVKYEYTRGSA